MRLTILSEGKTRRQRLSFWLMRRLLSTVPGPIATMSYRPQFFGAPMSLVFEQAMVEATEWSRGETELFAALVSSYNTCHY